MLKTVSLKDTYLTIQWTEGSVWHINPVVSGWLPRLTSDIRVRSVRS